jgi:hypothetical protein
MSSRQQNVAENELIEALSSVILKDPPDRAKECPNSDELSLFVHGRADAKLRERLVAHLSSCDWCIRLLKRRRQRRRATEAALTFAAAAVLVFAIVWGLRTPTQTPATTQTVDLRPLSPTRGEEGVAATGEIPTISEKTSRLRLILPAGSEGKYECEILSGRKNQVLMHVSGETALQNHEVVLKFSMRPPSFQTGRYLLALRKQGQGWIYYPLAFK